MNGRNDEAQFLRQMLTQRADFVEQLPALLGISQRDQPESDFECEIVELQSRVHRVDGRGSLGVGLWSCHAGDRVLLGRCRLL